jgi:hypothetical protein
MGALGPINTLSFDHGSGSPESQLALLPDINKPPLVFEKREGGEKRYETTHHFAGGDSPYGSSDGFGARWGSRCR